LQDSGDPWPSAWKIGSLTRRWKPTASSSRRVPGEVHYQADRLECIFFSAYDPYFEGDEPPGL
jgi:hypothetical protein